MLIANNWLDVSMAILYEQVHVCLNVYCIYCIDNWLTLGIKFSSNKLRIYFIQLPLSIKVLSTLAWALD